MACTSMPAGSPKISARTDGATRTSLSRSNTVQLNPFRLDTLAACP